MCLRYDEWVKADRIIWPVEKGTKKRQRKKVKVRGRAGGGARCDDVRLESCDVTSSCPVSDDDDVAVCPQNKDEVDREREDEKPAVKVGGAKRGRPQIRTTPTNAPGRSVSKTPSSEGRANGKRAETSGLSNGDSKSSVQLGWRQSMRDYWIKTQNIPPVHRV